MLILPPLAAVAASLGWASGIVLAQRPAQRLGAFEFTRVQLVACSAIVAVLATVLGLWSTVDWSFWPGFAVSSGAGILLGNLAMIECLRRGGPRRTELLLALKAPLVGVLAFLWLGEAPSRADAIGAMVVLVGVAVAIASKADHRSRSDAVAGPLSVVLVLGLGAAGLQGLGFLVMKPAMAAGLEPLAATAIRLLGAAFLISLVALWPAPSLEARTAMTPRLLGRTILPGFIGYVVSSSLLLYAFATYDAAIAATLGSLSPVLVLPLVWLKDGVRPSVMAIAGAWIAVAGTTVIVAF